MLCICWDVCTHSSTYSIRAVGDRDGFPSIPVARAGPLPWGPAGAVVRTYELHAKKQRQTVLLKCMKTQYHYYQQAHWSTQTGRHTPTHTHTHTHTTPASFSLSFQQHHLPPPLKTATQTISFPSSKADPMWSSTLPRLAGRLLLRPILFVFYE